MFLFCFIHYFTYALRARNAHPHKNVQSYKKKYKLTNNFAKKCEYFLKSANNCSKTTTKFAKLVYFLYLCLRKSA